MDQGDGEDVTPLMSPPWTRGRWPVAVDGIDGHDNGQRDSGCDAAEDHGELDNNRTFLDTETLCSRSGSLSHHLHPTPLHHYQGRSVHADNRIHEQRPHAYVPAFANVHCRQRSEPQSQSERRHPLAELDTSDSMTAETRDLGDDSFLLPPRPTSIATTSMSLTTSMNTIDAGTENLMSPLTSYHRSWREGQKIELRLPTDCAVDDSQPLSLQQCHELLSELDSECLFPESVFTAGDRRPSSSRSHVLQWRRNRSSEPESSQYLHASPDGRPPTPDSRPSTTITREEFESLPPTIKRKYFTTIERSQLSHYSDLEYRSHLGSAGHDQLSPRSSLPKAATTCELQERPVTSDTATLHSDLRPRITSTDQRFYANLPEKIKRRHLTQDELLIAQDKQIGSSEAVEEAPDQGNKRPGQDPRMQSPLSSPGLSDGQSSFSSMPHRHSDREGRRSDSKRPDSFYESFRWLEDEEGLDLRLYLDDYHINLREEVPVPNKSRRPSFRRHLSINKLPFGRPSVSYNRPMPKDGMVSPTLVSPSTSHNSAVGSSVHNRRKSRALSLISANKQMPLPPRSSPTIDPAATHYQDPEARMKLRAYLASPQKFDEAIEFGFPSQDGSRPSEKPKGLGLKKENAKQSDKFRSFLEDDRSSSYSDEASVAEPDSPKTPQLFDKPAPVRPTRTSAEQHVCPKTDKIAQEQASSREMTLRMTLTRPDLRQSEDQIYGWRQPSSSRGGTIRDDSTSNTVIYARDGNPKESIERQLAALDQWDDCPDHDNGVVKRFWNRVKRT
ncbi:hypothetical protein FDECE_2241 [Fusarium decemcellulare]|nr:hypothetical protein FDECE_2241 [Fusarium decemcellulare]